MANTYIAIATTTVGSGGAANIEFTSIPSSYTDLCLVWSLRCDSTSTVSKVQFNNDTSTSNYSQRRLYGDSVNVTSDSSTSLGYISPIGSGTSTSTSNTFSNVQLYIPNYAGSSNKSLSVDATVENNASTAGSSYQTLTAGLWSQTSAITSIKISPNSGNFVQYSTATLYGIKKD